MAYKGIDVSSYQGNIDWSKVKWAGVQFAILKIIRKDLNPDKTFEQNWKGCTDAGMPIQGVYNYSYATTVDKAKTDAQRVIEVLNGRKTFVWLDVEDKCQQGLGQTLIDIINTYQSVIKSAGLNFGVYTGLSFYNQYIAPYANQINCPFWIARYPSTKGMSIGDEPNSAKKPVIQHSLYGWQYSSAFTCSGLNNSTDANLLYIELNKGDGIENSSAPIATPVKNNAWKGNEEYYLDNDDVRKWQHRFQGLYAQEEFQNVSDVKLDTEKVVADEIKENANTVDFDEDNIIDVEPTDTADKQSEELPPFMQSEEG